jgi:hypothetical protein
MADTEAVLFANEAFYRAFARRDLEAMDELWSRTAPVCCIHPGWAPIFGRDEVLASWAAILGDAESPDIECSGARAQLLGAAAFVVCYESLGGGHLTATNMFVREGAVWKLVHHQAGPVPSPPPVEDINPERSVH